MTFIIATNNAHKLLELKRILTPLGIAAKSPAELGITLPEVDETGATFEENAFLKVQAAHTLTGLAAIADDSGLCVDALNGAPGVFSARYAGEDATNEERIAKLLRELQDVPAPKRTARFVSAICLVFANGQHFTVRGECEGIIAFAPSGNGGFGYDPVFLWRDERGGQSIESLDLTGLKSFAQLTSAQKDAVSHRSKSLQELSIKLQQRRNQC